METKEKNIPVSPGEEWGPDVTLDQPAFIHPSALIYGKVTINKGVSLWPYSVIRAERFEVVIGENTNVQDFVMLHIGDKQGTRIGSHCSLAHRCIIHGAEIGDNCIIGIGAVILEGCVVGAHSLVTPGTVLREKTVIPEGSIVSGSPGRVVMKRNNWVPARFYSQMYRLNADAYAQSNHRAWAGDGFTIEARQTMEQLTREGKLKFPAKKKNESEKNAGKK
ncbi:MAG: gamma carbonic anhydrase family protein [bacterium]|nr:gamma carbonic anhydrase family protein [bacterium]